MMIAAAAAVFGCSPASNTECLASHVCNDTPAIVSAEEKEVLRSTQARYRNSDPTFSYSEGKPLSKPLGVHIVGDNATLRVSAPIGELNLIYAQIWYEIYRKHHKDARSVRMRVVWKSGGVDQVFPLPWGM